MNHSEKQASAADPLAFLAGGGEMGRLMRAQDWSATPLGPVSGWPQSLKTAVRIILGSRYPMFIWWGRELVNLYNDGYLPMLGQRHPAALGKPAAVIWSEIWDTIGPQTDAVLSEGRATWNEERLLVLERNGYPEEAYFTFSYSPVPSDDGGVGGIFCALTEDTQRVLGQRRLRTLRELSARTTGARTVEQACQAATDTLTQNPHDLPFALIYLLDGQGKVARLAGMTGLADDSPAHPASIDLMSSDGRAACWPLDRVAATGRAELVEGLEARCGRLRCGVWPDPPQSAIVLPVMQSGQDRLAGFLVAGISPRRVFDDDYRGFTDLLAGHIATAIANARAYEEEKWRAEALAEIDRAKTMFFSNVSHEFRTPLTLMLGPVGDLLARSRTDLSPAAADQLEVVNRNGLRLLRLVNTLLDFSRIEAGRVRAVYQPTDLAAFTADLASVFRAAVEKVGLRLSIDCPPLGEPVFVDPEMWEQVVLNLLSNAFKFTFDGEIAVTLKQVGDAAELRVSDTGTGIPPEEMPRLFERFHRVHNARSRTHEGSGIGLALVQELVRLHGGSIAAESVEGVGTTFTVTVPLGSAHLPTDQIGDGRRPALAGTGATPYVEEALRWLPDDAGAEQEDRSELPTYHEPLPTPYRRAQPDDADRPRVLVADDNADMRQYVTRLLAEAYRTEAVPDGEAALAAARHQRPDLILMDVMMPRLDGFGLLRAIRADPELSGLPVILLSARAGEESRVEGMEAGADDYLVKPFGARELLARVSAHLQMARLRRESERAVRESEERFRAFVSASSDVVYRMSADWSEMRFLRGREFIADTHEPSRTWLQEYIHPDDRPQVMKAIGEAVRTKSVFESEHRVVRLDGTVGWAFSRAVPLLGTDGEIVGWFGAASDVTARKRAEEELQKERDRLRVTLASIGDAVITTDTERRITFLNGVAESLTGWTNAEAVGQPLDAVFRIVNEDSRQPVENPALRALQEGIVVGLANHTVLIRKDGTERPVNDSASPVRDGQGYVVGFVLVFRDVSEQRRLEKEKGDRFRAARLLAAIVESSDDAIISKSLDGIIQTWNAAAERLFGFPAEQAVGRHISLIIPAERADEEDRILARLRAGEQVYHFDTVRVRSDGQPVHVSLTISPVRDEAGRIVGASKIARDITDRKQDEERIYGLMTQLKEANLRKNEFLAMLAHELRNPLAPLLNMLEIMKRGDGNGEVIERVRSTLERQLGQMVRLVDDLLDMSRITRSKLELRKERVDLASVIHQSVEACRPLAERAKHELNVSLPPEPIYLHADPVRLAQVFGNLLNNACKYTEPGGRIWLTAERQGSDVVVNVKDTGLGIPSDKLASIFEMFTQIDRSLERSQGGLGIGLTLVKRLVEMHGGSVEAYSEGQGRGSEFVVRLPILVEQSKAETLEPTADQTPTTTHRILIVDDNRDAATSLATLLKMTGNETQTAHDGLAAVEVAAAFRPEVVLLDIGLPKLSGYDACRRIRQQSWGKNMVLVALTGWGQDEDRRQSKDAGFDHHMVKPLDFAALMRLLAELKVTPV